MAFCRKSENFRFGRFPFIGRILKQWTSPTSAVARPLRIVDPERYLILRLGWSSAVVLLLSFFLPLFRGISPANWARLFVLALVGIAGYQWVFFRAASILDPVPLVLILSLGPVIVALYSHLRGHESFSVAQWGAMGLILSGIALVVQGGAAHGSVGSRSGATLAGLGLALVSLLFFTVSTIVTRTVLREVRTTQATLIPIFLGGLLVLPFHPSWVVLSPAVRQPVVLLALFYSVFMSLFLAYFLWNVAVGSIGPSRASLWSNGQPLVTAVGTVLFLGQSLSMKQFLGGGLAMAGFWVFFGREIVGTGKILGRFAKDEKAP